MRFALHCLKNALVYFVARVWFYLTLPLTVEPVVLDGWIWVMIAWFGFTQAYLTSTEAYEYVAPFVLFWLKYAIGSGAAMCGALKAFRSTSYAEHLKKQLQPQQTA